MSTDFKKYRKQMLMQLLLLIVICLAISQISWIARRGTLTLSLTPYETLGYQFEPGQNQIRWEGAELPTREVLRENGRLDVFIDTESVGTYTMYIENRAREGSYLYLDNIYVTKYGLAYSASTGNFTGDNGVMFAITLFFFGLGMIGLAGFLRLKGSMLYSYDAIFYVGGGIYCAATGIYLAILVIARLIRPELYHMDRILLSVAGAPGSFAIYTSPLVLIFSVLMIISNIELLRHERFRVNNVLGLGIGVLMIGCEVFLFFFLSRSFMGSTEELRVFTTVNSVVAAVFVYFECILAGAVVCGFRASKHVPDADRDYILILGCRFRPDGTLTPLLRGRADKAVEFWRKQKEETGKEAVLVPSGGQGSDESMPEAEAIGRYLVSCGVPESAILKEDRSLNTYQNMEYSKKKIREREEAAGNNPDEVRTMYVTTNYHVFRSGVWANNAGFPSEGLGSRTKWWFWPNAFIREFVGLLVNKLVVETVWLIIIMFAFSLIAFLTSAVY